MTPEQRALAGRIGALRMHAAGKTNTAPAQAAFDARFYRDIPDDLPPAERDRRAGFARRAYFAELALKSSKARSRKRMAAERHSRPGGSTAAS